MKRLFIFPHFKRLPIVFVVRDSLYGVDCASLRILKNDNADRETPANIMNHKLSVVIHLTSKPFVACEFDDRRELASFIQPTACGLLNFKRIHQNCLPSGPYSDICLTQQKTIVIYQKNNFQASNLDRKRIHPGHLTHSLGDY